MRGTDIETDVIVVGSGVGGALAAYAAASRGRFTKAVPIGSDASSTWLGRRRIQSCVTLCKDIVVRILFTFVGGSGHVDPLAPVARAAEAAGHTVAFGCGPSMVSTVEAAGFTVFAMGMGTGSAPERMPLRPLDVEREDRDFRDRFARRAAQYRAPRTIALCTEWRPDILVCDETGCGGIVAAERLGRPHATVAEFGPQPANVCIERYIAQSSILPHCSLVISHGGSGSVIGALAHGLPSVLIPIGADQPMNAVRCKDLGVGRVLNAIGATPETVRDAVSAVLADASYRRAAEHVRNEFAALPGPAHAIRLLERLAAGNYP